MTAIQKRKAGQTYFLTEIRGAKVYLGEKRIGKLKDMVIEETGKIPIVTHIVVSRPFGDPALLIPWDKVKSLSTKEVIIDIESVKQYEEEPAGGSILLADHVLDKKVLDTEGREVDVVYDVKLIMRYGKLYVSKVDFSWHGLLRRMGLRWLSDFIYNMTEKSKEETISWSYIEPLPTELGSFKGNVKLKVLKEKLADMPPVDVADILEELDHDQRVALFNQLETEHASDTLEEIDPNVQRALISSLDKGKVAQLLNEMTVGQAADVLSVLPRDQVEDILELLDKDDAKKIRAILERQEENILNYVTEDIIKLPPDMTADQAQENFPHYAKGKDTVVYLYIVDPRDKLLGVIDLKELLKADDKALLKDVMNDNVVSLSPDSTLKEAYETFVRYSFRAIPVVDDNGKILGVILHRDVMNIKHRFWE